MLEALNLSDKRFSLHVKKEVGNFLGKTKIFKVPRVILANCPQLPAILESANWYFLIYAVFMKPTCTSTKSDHSQCTSTENY